MGKRCKRERKNITVLITSLLIFTDMLVYADVTVMCL